MISRSLTKRLVLSLSLCALCSAGVTGSVSEPDRQGISHFGQDDGLCHPQIQVIIQDRSGFLWVGSHNGLNRFDGYDFECLRNDVENPLSLGTDNITALLEDADGDLWVGTWGAGLQRFLPEQQGFAHYRSNPDEHGSLAGDIISCLYQDRDGRIWVGTKPGGLQRLDEATGRFERVLPVVSDDQTRYVADVIQDSYDRIWIAIYGGGVVVLDAEERVSKTFRYDPEDPENPSGLGSNYVWFVHEDHSGGIWIGTQNGLHRYDPNNGSLMRIEADPADPEGLASSDVRSCAQDRQGRLWLGTWGGGISILEPISGRITRPDPDLFAGRKVRDIYQDVTGIIWVGTWEGGLFRYNPDQDRFATFRHDPEQPGSLGDNQVWSFLEEDDGTLWIGHDSGLDRRDSGSDTFVGYRSDPTNSRTISAGGINALYRRGNDLWLGTWHGGLNRMDVETGNVTRYPTGRRTPDSASGEKIKVIEPAGDGSLWLAVFDSGLDRFDPESETFTHFVPDPEVPGWLGSPLIRAIEVQDRETTWIGTDYGLERYRESEGRFERFVHDPQRPGSLSHKRVQALLWSRAGALWVGTAAGLNLMVAEDVFRRFRKGKGKLVDENIYGIAEDTGGNLWLSTDRGLVEMDPREETFRYYDTSDGIQGRVYQMGAAHKGPSGTLYFGGTNGFDAFDPSENIVRNRVPPRVVLTDFLIYDHRIDWGEGARLPVHISQLDRLALRHDENYFTFEFTAPNLRDPDKTLFRYRLDGVDKEWVISSADRRFVTYANLGPGNYEFRVEAANDDAVWSEDGASIEIVLDPPPWLSEIAIAIYLTTGIGLLVALIYTIRRRQLEAFLIREKEAAEIASEAKSRFLSNMSHELRTPLNAILGFSQLMCRDEMLSQENRRNLEVINKSGEHLLSVINDVLEMSKIESGKATLHPVSFDIRVFLRTLREMFALVAEEKGLELFFRVDSDIPHYLCADEGKLRQILTNLLGNAVKFTRYGSVSLRCHAERGEGSLRLCFEVEDTGPGIAPRELSRLFSPFVQTETGRRSRQGTGLGLAISRELTKLMGGDMTAASELGKGTCFRFQIECRESEEAEFETSEENRRVLGIERGSRRRILVVDDHPRNREVVIRMLSPVGFELREAENGREALEIMETFQAHLVLLDKQMPVMDGLETTRALRERHGEELRIIALTASAFEEDRRELMAEGCNDFLTKPFREEILFGKLRRALGIEYRYEDSPTEKTEPTLGLESLPSSLAERLEQATLLGDLDVLDEVISRIEVEVDGGVARQLRQQVDEFAYGEILENLGRLRRLEGYQPLKH